MERLVKKAISDIATWVEDWYGNRTPTENRLTFQARGEGPVLCWVRTDYRSADAVDNKWKRVLSGLSTPLKPQPPAAAVAKMVEMCSDSNASSAAASDITGPPEVPATERWLWSVFHDQSVLGYLTPGDLMLLRDTVFGLARDRLRDMAGVHLRTDRT